MKLFTKQQRKAIRKNYVSDYINWYKKVSDVKYMCGIHDTSRNAVRRVGKAVRADAKRPSIKLSEANSLGIMSYEKWKELYYPAVYRELDQRGCGRRRQRRMAYAKGEIL